MNKFIFTKGYAAILTVLILGFVLLIITTTYSLLAFVGNNGTRQISYKTSSYYLALSCLDQALLRYSKDSSYIGIETIVVDEEQKCNIEAVELPAKRTVIFRANASALSSFTRLELITNEDLEIQEYREL